MVKGLLARHIPNIFLLLFVISCQVEKKEFIDPNDDSTIPRSSLLSQLMKKIVTHDGSFDDMVDGGNCYSIVLPYTIFVNGEETIIDQVQDYDLILSSDIILIDYPITLTMHDYKTAIVADQEALQELSIGCNATDDDIECIDFVYPIVLSTYSSNTNTFGTKEALHDEEVYSFMESLDEFTVLSMNYPIDLLTKSGSILTAIHNDELQSEILEHQYSCDENDDY